MEDAGALLLNFLLQYYTYACEIPRRIVLPWHITEDDDEDLSCVELEDLLKELHTAELRINLPKNGREERLINLAAANAREYANRQGQVDLPVLLKHLFAATQPVQNMEAPILRIEAVDVSHTSGSATRAAMVVFVNGEPQRGLWRNYAFDTLEPEASTAVGDDYAVLAAWAERRVKEGPPWPDLLLVDGGRGQLGAVLRVFDQHGLKGRFCFAAIAKARDERGHSDRRAGNIEDRIFVPERSNPLNIKAGSTELLFLQHIRNTVHDFVIGRHRKARNNQALRGELNRIPGFGPNLARALWDRFDSLPEMALATDEELRGVAGMGSKRIQALREQLKSVYNVHEHNAK
jgi:excinuclease ABC subunit C